MNKADTSLAEADGDEISYRNDDMGLETIAHSVAGKYGVVW